MSLSAAARDRLLEQVATLPLLPEGVAVDLVTADGRPRLTFCHADGIATVAVDPETGEMNCCELAKAVAEVMAATGGMA